MRRTLTLAAQLFAAASIALAAAKWLNLSNPYWAAMPVWVVHQAYREELLFRAVLRIAGTLAGAALSLLVIWLHPPDIVTAMVLSAGVGLAAASAFWIGTVLSYGAFMSGITLLVVLLPELAGVSLSDDASLLAVPIDRILCTLIGVASVTAITFAFTPPRDVPLPPRVMEGRVRLTIHRFIYCAVMAGLAAALALAFPRFDIFSAAMMMVVYPMILSSAPNPKPILKGLIPGVIGGALAAVAYLFILRNFEYTSWLVPVTVTGLFLAFGAVMRAWPVTAPYGLDANMCFLVLAQVGIWEHGAADVAMAGSAVILATLAAHWSANLILLEKPVPVPG